MAERQSHTIVGDPGHPVETYPVEITDCEPGDTVVIKEIEALNGVDCPEQILGTVRKAEQHTTEMEGDLGPRVTGETLDVETESGTIYSRSNTGSVSIVDDSGSLKWHRTLAADSELERFGGGGL